MIDFSKYTKDEIIKGLQHISRIYVYDSLLSNLESAIESQKIKKVHEKAMDALENSTKAMNELVDWRKKCAKKYGDGKTVKLVNIPLSEINKGVKLQETFKKAEEERKKACKAEDEFYKDYQ